VIFEVSGDKTHTRWLGMGRMDIHGRLFHTFEPATYTILLLTDGSSNYGERENVIYFGTGGRQYVSLTRK
jgi:hypothetical protein